MTQHAHTPQVGWGRTAGYGAEAGIALAFGYALAFIGYAVVRSTLTLMATPHPDGTLAGTLSVTWIALAVPAFMLAAIFGILAAVLGALTALVLRVLVSRVNPTHAPQRAIGIGVAVCLTVSLALLVLLYEGLGVRWTPATAATLTFWLLVPLLIYVVAGGIVSWHVNRMLAA
jgi:hypothetical protein